MDCDNKIWSALMKDHNVCIDFFDTVFDGCILVTLCKCLFFTSKMADDFAMNIGNKSLEDINATIKYLQSLMTEYSIVFYWRQLLATSHNIDFENILLFMQQNSLQLWTSNTTEKQQPNCLLLSIFYYLVPRHQEVQLH